jgi:hypothetical protein
MRIRIGLKEASWMLPGAALMFLLTLAVAHFQKEQNPEEQLAFKTRRVDLVNRMRIGLASASDAEKSAVMAITDRDSKTFADQARADTADVERERQELERLLKTGGTQNEKDLFVQFSQAFKEFQRIDNDLLDLAVRNTNLRAYSLTFGPGADAVREMNGALSRIVAANTGSPEAKNIMLLAFGAETAALRIQTLLAPHIAEESDEKMDRMEASMAREDEQVRSALNGLKAQLLLSSNADLAHAISSYTAFSKLRAQILALSRENTNVRSLTISLSQKRKVILMCEDALNALSATMAKAKRGETPQCQEGCTATHSASMRLLLEEHAKTGDRIKYQKAVEDEVHRYSQCLTNCSVPMSVK